MTGLDRNDRDLVLTGAGAVTAAAVGLEAHWQLLREGMVKSRHDEYTMRGFNAAPHLSDRRMLKAVSAVDAIGLAAVEGLKKHLALAPNAYSAERTGLYVGAPPASAFDNEAYVEAMEASRDATGRMSIAEFGRTCMTSRPTTLLVGLPNNVLCYGAMILDARGPNSNYTALGTSGHLALINAARRVRRGQLDLAVAGGFTAHTEDVNSRIFARLGAARSVGPATTEAYGEGAPGPILADGSVFVALERRDAAVRRGAEPLATILGWATGADARGPVTVDEDGAACEATIRRALADGGVSTASIGLILATGAAVPAVDRGELAAFARIFGRERAYPALGYSTRVLGHLTEAGGLLELGIVGPIYADGQVPKAMRVRGVASEAGAFASAVDEAKPCALVLRATPWGEYSCVVVRKE